MDESEDAGVGRSSSDRLTTFEASNSGSEPSLSRLLHKKKQKYGQTIFTPNYFTIIPTSYHVMNKVWQLCDLSLPETGHDGLAVSFLSLGIMTGRDVEVGMTFCDRFSLTVKSVGATERNSTRYPPCNYNETETFNHNILKSAWQLKHLWPSTLVL